MPLAGRLSIVSLVRPSLGFHPCEHITLMVIVVVVVVAAARRERGVCMLEILLQDISLREIKIKSVLMRLGVN